LPGSMGPKVKACIRFIEEAGGKAAIITHLEKALDALEGKTGTWIVPD
ncbi:MAG: carbamate kinase, partial [Candidatus Korarchaeota archaeon]|nr:carbamate kinase [Candidatus Korarchaeota archaeon]